MNEAIRIAQALAQMEGVASVTRGWPKQTAKLPCVAVGLTQQSTADTRDNAVYLTQSIYTLRIFAATMSACDALQISVISAMEALGYTLTQTAEVDGEIAQQLMTFQTLD